jgi:Ohr subfamily peroxiredoxin
MIASVKVLATAHASAIGGRNGHSETPDKLISVDLSVPKEMGGPGKPGTVTPEHLFAAGYAACFGGAVDFIATSHKKSAKAAKVTADVGVGPREGGGFGLTVTLHVEDASVPQAELEQFVHEAHEKICPYSHATRGNIAVSFDVKGG